MDATKRCGSDGMRESPIDQCMWVSSIQGLGISITLAIVMSSIVKVSIGSIALGGGIKSLGDWVKTSAGAEWDAVVGRVVQLWVSLTLAIVAMGVAVTMVVSVTGKMSMAGTRLWDVGTVHTRRTLQPNNLPNTGVMSMALTMPMSMAISMIMSMAIILSRDIGHEDRYCNL